MISARRLAPLLTVLLVAACGPATSDLATAGGAGGGGGGAVGWRGWHRRRDPATVPAWPERSVLALTDAVRMSPAHWKARWSGGSLGTGMMDGYADGMTPLR
ncbi:MAG: hypothetical protein QM767_27980 [Anaeromyxobacter sp.]